MNLQDMKAAAEKATSGKYGHDGNGVYTVNEYNNRIRHVVCLCEEKADAAHIANCSPERILAMIAVCEAAFKYQAWQSAAGVKISFDAALAALEAMP